MPDGLCINDITIEIGNRLNYILGCYKSRFDVKTIFTNETWNGTPPSNYQLLPHVGATTDGQTGTTLTYSPGGFNAFVLDGISYLKIGNSSYGIISHTDTTLLLLFSPGLNLTGVMFEIHRVPIVAGPIRCSPMIIGIGASIVNGVLVAGTVSGTTATTTANGLALDYAPGGFDAVVTNGYSAARIVSGTGVTPGLYYITNHSDTELVFYSRPAGGYSGPGMNGRDIVFHIVPVNFLTVLTPQYGYPGAYTAVDVVDSDGNDVGRLKVTAATESTLALESPPDDMDDISFTVVNCYPTTPVGRYDSARDEWLYGNCLLDVQTYFRNFVYMLTQLVPYIGPYSFNEDDFVEHSEDGCFTGEVLANLLFITTQLGVPWATWATMVLTLDPPIPDTIYVTVSGITGWHATLGPYHSSLGCFDSAVYSCVGWSLDDTRIACTPALSPLPTAYNTPPIPLPIWIGISLTGTPGQLGYGYVRYRFIVYPNACYFSWTVRIRYEVLNQNLGWVMCQEIILASADQTVLTGPDTAYVAVSIPPFLNTAGPGCLIQWNYKPYQWYQICGDGLVLPPTTPCLTLEAVTAVGELE